MGYEEQATGTMGIPYYDSLLPEEQQEVTEAVKLLLRQTFVLGGGEQPDGSYLHSGRNAGG